MEQYNVTGMSCAACSARVEKAVNKVPGVTSCSVSLLTNSWEWKELPQLCHCLSCRRSRIRLQPEGRFRSEGIRFRC